MRRLFKNSLLNRKRIKYCSANYLSYSKLYFYSNMIKSHEIITESFKTVEENISFPKSELEVLEYWDKIDAFKTQLEKTKDFPPYTFYDGPPFATGLPHYGHITAGTLKDVVTRYWTQNGRFCERKFGWDCHGLPIECIINERENIKSKKDLINYGIANYNKKCREGVMEYAGEWEDYTRRFGRWIDFKNDYKTMDRDFMESVWWVFKQIYDKGLVYRKCKVMPYSWACNTVLSNFEAGSNYKDIADPSIYITFPFVKNPKRAFIAWTTTPWTLPSNLAVTLNPELIYVVVLDKVKEVEYVFAEALLEKVTKAIKLEEYEVLEKLKGKDLEGTEYVPLFDDFIKYREQGCFKALCDTFVTSVDGTGVVHTAPAFGEDDFKVGVSNGIVDQDKPLCPIDDDGNFTQEFALTAGMNFKKADPVICEELKTKGRLLAKGVLNHQYPMCYRTGEPLMYKAIPSWFIAVEKVKEDLLENNKKAEWVPKYVQEKRFHNWLQDARDWCISRSRAWGNPIPLWVSDDMEERVCITSLKELVEYTGLKDAPEDIHREFLDQLTIPSKQGKGLLKRIPEVFDCWFESGSMPYAQLSYPFKLSQEEFEKRYPADFIAEGLDQTRGWFYTLNVISTILFNKNPYKNLIVNGLVLAADGKKMSKKDKNYPDPRLMAEVHGADAVRLYLMNSQLVKGQSLRFKEEGLKDVVKDIFLPLYNSYKFLVQNIQRFEKANTTKFMFEEKYIKNNFDKLNLTDKWILAYSQRLIKFVRNEMEHYRLYTVVSELLNFLEKLTNWYIRLNRNRIKGDYGVEEAHLSLSVLFMVTLDLIILLSPFIPFLTESIYQNLKNGIENPEASVHFLQIPKANETFINEKIEKVIQDMICVIDQGRYLREQKKIVMKMPIAKIQVVNSNQAFIDNIKLVENYVIEELNANEIEYIVDESKYVKVSANPNFQVLYTKSKEIKDQMEEENKLDDPELKAEEEKLKKEANLVAAVIKKLDEKSLHTLLIDGAVDTGDKQAPKITLEQVLIKREFLKEFQKDKEFHVHANAANAIRISTEVNDKMMNAFYARDLTNKVQKMRKETGIKISDEIVITYSYSDSSIKLKAMLESGFKDSILKTLKVPFILFDKESITGFERNSILELEVAEEKITVEIYKKN